ncbi:hypothetical protein TTRE_0000648601 [Trichuris trichiura]|uniref:Uncharacterized protein n=1 Tax=Trichuris trichiura TaxID=36087 RepID=A0A077ZCR1_TRITR|nr:hypothetical protein TTRE_0000648601 [Trichuris trichiura]
MEDLSLNQIVGRVQAIIKDERPIGVQEVRPFRKYVSAPETPRHDRKRKAQHDEKPPSQKIWRNESQASGKRVRGGTAGAGILASQTMIGALPTVQVEVDGGERNVLVDFGCSKCVAQVSCCASWRKSPASIVAVDGSEIRCQGLGTVQLQSVEGGRARVDVVVTARKPLGFDVILGMNAVTALGVVSISPQRHVRFGTEREEMGAAGVAGIKLEGKDFALTFDPVARCWTAAWRWSDATGDGSAEQWISRVHHAVGHPGVRRTVYFARRVQPTVSKRLLGQVVTDCEICQKVDSAPVKWKRGTLAVQETWQRVGTNSQAAPSSML